MITKDKGDTAYCHRKTSNNSHNDGNETLAMNVIGYCQLTQCLRPLPVAATLPVPATGMTSVTPWFLL